MEILPLGQKFKEVTLMYLQIETSILLNIIIPQLIMDLARFHKLTITFLCLQLITEILIRASMVSRLKRLSNYRSLYQN
jgi:hypothetical protein